MDSESSLQGAHDRCALDDLIWQVIKSQNGFETAAETNFGTSLQCTYIDESRTACTGAARVVRIVHDESAAKRVRVISEDGEPLPGLCPYQAAVIANGIANDWFNKKEQEGWTE